MSQYKPYITGSNWSWVSGSKIMCSPWLFWGPEAIRTVKFIYIKISIAFKAEASSQKSWEILCRLYLKVSYNLHRCIAFGKFLHTDVALLTTWEEATVQLDDDFEGNNNEKRQSISIDFDPFYFSNQITYLLGYIVDNVILAHSPSMQEPLRWILNQ